MVVLGLDHAHGLQIISAAQARADVELCALAQATPPFREDKAKELGVRAYRDYGECLDREQPDIVGVAMCNGARGKWIAEALSRGIPVITDKPLCVTSADYGSIVAAQHKSGAALCLMLTERLNPRYLAIKQAVSAGDIGAPLHIEAMRHYALNPAQRPRWMFDPASYGGPALDILIHDYDLARWMIGRAWVGAQKVEFCSGFCPEPGFCDRAMICGTDQGVSLSLCMSWNSPDKHWAHFCVYGDAGWAEVPLCASDKPRLCRNGEVRELDLPAPQNFAASFFRSLLDRDTPPPLTTEESLAVMRDLLAL